MTTLGFPDQFDKDISYVIASYITVPPYRLRPEFADKMAPHKMYWHLSQNKSPHVIPILSAVLPTIRDDIDWYALSSNEHLTYEFIRNNADYIVWSIACKNACANIIDFLIDNPRYIKWYDLSHNSTPKAIEMLKANLDKVDWRTLSWREDMIDVLESNIDKIDWFMLSGNRAAIHLLARNLDKVDFDSIARNSAAIDIIRDNPRYINMDLLCQNIAACNTVITVADMNWWYVHMDETTVNTIRELLKDPNNSFIIDRLNWLRLSELPYAIDIIEANMDKVAWTTLSFNPAAIHILKKNMDKVHWNGLSMNPAAIDILLENPLKIKWSLLYTHNDSIFEIDDDLYKVMLRERVQYIYEL